jgi:hypothetical protein
MQLENKVVITASIVVDVDPGENGASSRLQRIVETFRHAVCETFAADHSVQCPECIAYDWLNDPEANFGRCENCKRLLSNYEKPRQIRGLIDAKFIDGSLLCDECDWLRRGPTPTPS